MKEKFFTEFLDHFCAQFNKIISILGAIRLLGKS